MRRALQYSSNIYFYEMGARLGPDRIAEWGRYYGFGSPTGIDLPGEDPGQLPDRAFRERYREPWSLGHTTATAIGQILSVNLVQLARYTAAIANGGTLLRPYLVQEIRTPDGQVVHRTQPQAVGTVPQADRILPVLREGMLLVNGPGGTSDFAFWPLPGIPVAGKTGSAQNPPRVEDGLYVAFAPADRPQVAVAVIIEQAAHGASVSPVARAILAEYFGVPLRPDDPARVPDGWPEGAGANPQAPQAGRG